MRLKNVMRLTLDKMIFQKGSLILTLVLLCMGLFSMGMVLTSRAVNSYARDACDSVLTKGIQRTGSIYVKDWLFSSPEALAFLQEAEASDIIYSIGVIEDRMKWDNRLSELWEVQRNLPGMDPESKMLSVVIMSGTAMDLCKLSFQEVREINEDEWNTEGWFGLYLGANFKDIPVGTRYTVPVRDTEWVYEVVGILEKDSRILSGAVLFTAMGNGFSTCTQLDDLIICINNAEPGTAGWGYSPEDGVSMEEARKYLAELAEKYGLPVSFASLSAGFDYGERESARANSILMEIFVMICLVTFLVDVCIFFIAFLNHMEEYGIFYAMGISRRDMIKMLLVENILKCLFAFLFTWGILYAYELYRAGADPTVRFAMNEVMYHEVFQKLLLIDVASIFAFTAIPAVTLYYSKPVSLLKGMRA